VKTQLGETALPDVGLGRYSIASSAVKGFRDQLTLDNPAPPASGAAFGPLPDGVATLSAAPPEKLDPTPDAKRAN
jgi:hypothetical protein